MPVLARATRKPFSSGFGLDEDVDAEELGCGLAVLESGVADMAADKSGDNGKMGDGDGLKFWCSPPLCTSTSVLNFDSSIHSI